MAKKLIGKVALVTGATSGIGLATAKRFANEGAFVYITGRRRDKLEAAAAAIGVNARGVVGDVGDLGHLDEVIQIISEEQGKIDIVVPCAAFAQAQPLGSITEESFDATFGINVRATMFTVQKALPIMADGGSIVLMGSIAGAKGNAGRSVYSASKATLRSFARSWTMDLKARRIRVNVLSPGPTETASFANTPAEAKARLAAQIPMERLARPDEIANAVLFLASDEASFVTGIEMFADGGFAQV
ncbi:SDR family oxidoreductase [Rhizobium sp. S152]|uniref:SDR family NAD(P)-dependent oxidoreductase n=1 Tax=Rhizobium sp. S152 TaxID=3055038 RepID=UPI0025A98F59|nr:SDR family oxidoreductase [Rhizobium sp. S152]MDM9628495.1 SDR family oxidoreductase [Rhizobium sp. S152]